jgi:hypothetical protein
MKLEKSANAWGTSDFAEVFKQEVAEHADDLPLQQGLSSSSYALTDRIEAMIIGSMEEEGVLKVKAGIFFEGVLGGCSCADDPTPVENQPEYCEMLVEIDGKTGEATASVSRDS